METEVIVKPEDRTVVEVMHATSGNASVVFLGMMDPEPGTEADYARRMEKLVEGLNTTVFVRNAGEFAGRLI